MRNISRNKYIVILLTIVCVMTIGFAVLSTNVTLNGNTTVVANTWGIKFENIVEGTDNNVEGTTTITNDNTIDILTTLSEPGDKYSFIVDVVNTGSVDVMLDSIVKSGLTDYQSTYQFKFYLYYADGQTINKYDKLEKDGGTETIYIIIEYKPDIGKSDLQRSSISLNIKANIIYVQADENAVEVTHNDLQKYIIKAKKGLATSDDVGDILEYVNGDYTYNIRVANVSNPSECNDNNYSQTACGVVLEYADVIYTGDISDFSYSTEPYGHNKGGFINSKLFSNLNGSSNNYLKNAMINTRIVSNPGYQEVISTDSNGNYIATCKSYVFSLKEIFGDYPDDSLDYNNNVISYDSSKNYTRQLDYYSNEGVTITNTAGAMKKYKDSYHEWWTRTTNIAYYTTFYEIHEENGKPNSIMGAPRLGSGISPAFRVA